MLKTNESWSGNATEKNYYIEDTPIEDTPASKHILFHGYCFLCLGFFLIHT